MIIETLLLSRENGFQTMLRVIMKSHLASYLFGEKQSLYRDENFGVERDITRDVEKYVSGQQN